MSGRSRHFALLLGVLAILCLLIPLLLLKRRDSPTPTAPAVGVAGEVERLVPSAWRARADDAPVRLSRASPVYWQDVVQTEPIGRLRLMMVDGSVLNIGANARLRLTDRGDTSLQPAILLEFGKLRIAVKKPAPQDRKYEVQTQSAVLGVIGTEFYLDATEERTRVICLHGRVWVRNRREDLVGEQILNAGEKTEVLRERPPEQKTVASPEEIADAIAETSPSRTVPSETQARGKTFTQEERRLEASARVLERILSVRDAIPQKLLDAAKCVVVIPSTKKLGLGLGLARGRGAMVCRTGKDFTGPWGPPSMYRVVGSSLGLQIGDKTTDLIFLATNSKGAEQLLRGNFQLDTDVPDRVAWKARAPTAIHLQDGVWSYFHSSGLFAGISLERSSLRQDRKANENLYGREAEARMIVAGGIVPVPRAGRRLVALLQRASPRRRALPGERS